MGCLPGSFCDAGSEIGFACPEGYYCPVNTTSSTQRSCEVGHYCPRGSSSPKNCEAGTHTDQQVTLPFTVTNSGDKPAKIIKELYQSYRNHRTNKHFTIPQNQASCGQCPPKFYCVGDGTAQPCPKGFYCPTNTSDHTVSTF